MLKLLFLFAAGQRLESFEITITRIATRVKKIVNEKIGSREGSDIFDSNGSSFSDEHNDCNYLDEPEVKNRKWKRRKPEIRSRKSLDRRTSSSSSDYESDESEGPDSVISTSDEDTSKYGKN